MRRAAVLGLLWAGTAFAGGALAIGPITAAYGRTAHPRREIRPPSHFASCAGLVRFGRHYLARTKGIPETPVEPLDGSVGPPTSVNSGTAPSPGAPQATGAPGGSVSYSTTNNQEVGVEEPDTVKTDGSTIFAVSGNRLYAVGVTGGTPKLLDSLDLRSAGYGAQLLLDGDRLLVISSASPFEPVPLGAPGRGAAGPALIYPSPYYYRAQTTIERLDVSDPSAMKVIGTETIDGSFVDARQNGDTARIVISSAPRAIAESALRFQTAGYVPTWRYHGVITGRRMHGFVARCGQIARPQVFSGLGMATIFTVDIPHGLAFATTDALMADAQVVYGSQSSIYLATEKWIDPATPADQLPSTTTTQIDRFDASSPNSTTFAASGEVPGYLLNQFSLSESGGYLRVASTSQPDFWDGGVPQVPSQSYVTVLATAGNQLVPVGQLSGLGSGQKIYSVRFVGDIGYVVTFRQVDPLYTIDLSKPTEPKVAGQLELEGYSSYLHPLPGGLLLGVGQDVGTNNEPSGAQLELFDVSDPSAPKLLQKTSLGQGSSSQVQYDHHAFLFWPASDLAIIPVQIYPVSSGPPTPAPGAAGATTTSSSQPQGSGDQFTGAVGFHIDRSGMSELGRVSHPASSGSAPPISRSIVIGDRLYTLSSEGILASSLDTLGPLGFVAFP
jgi:Beta propeller domain